MTDFVEPGGLGLRSFRERGVLGLHSFILVSEVGDVLKNRSSELKCWLLLLSKEWF